MKALLSLAFLLAFTTQLHAQAFGNATCSGHVPDNPSTPALRARHCTFLTGDPAKPDALTSNILPVGEPLLVLGRSRALQGASFGAAWFLVKTRNGRQGYVPDYDLRCAGDADACAAAYDKSFP